MKKDYKKDLPKIDDIKDNYSNKVYFIIFAIIYILFYCGITKMFLKKWGLLSNISEKGIVLINIGFMLLTSIVFLFIYRKRLLRDLGLLIDNFDSYFRFNGRIFLRYLPYYILLSLAVGAIIYNRTENAESTNQLALSTVPIWVLSFLSVLMAPITEEGMFRWTIRKITNNKWLFIILSGFIFGFIHVNYWGEQEWIQLLHIVPYGILGMMMAEMYYDTNNLLASSLFHATWNLVMLLIQILLSFFAA